MGKLNNAPLSLRQVTDIFSQMWEKHSTPVGDNKEPFMAQPVKEETKFKGILLPDGLTFFTRYVSRDTKLEEYDRVLADCRLDGITVFQIGLHYPIGKLAKGKAYNLGDEAHMKRVRGNRVEIYLGDEDPAAGVGYTVEHEVNELPA